MADIVQPSSHAGHGHAAGHDHGHGHDHAHPPFLQHHFDSPVQQFDATKFGMWLFLATEILLFAGLFCAYAIYRANHPEIFDVGHLALDKKMGAINTVILLASSFTMACAVTAAQRGAKQALVILLSLTFLGGLGFMVVKFFEYKAKIEHGLLWGHNYAPHPHGEGEHGHGDPHAPASHPGDRAHGDTAAAPVAGSVPEKAAAPHGDSHAAAPSAAAPAAAGAAAAIGTAAADAWNFKPAGAAPTGLSLAKADAGHGGGHELPDFTKDKTRNVHIFFGIYFVMTGLHGIHVLIGMIVIAWLIWRANRGDFSADYFTPVDLGGLYWHLVDLIWIYLFPLLYLIQ